jgi:hypothetical protein
LKAASYEVEVEENECSGFLGEVKSVKTKQAFHDFYMVIFKIKQRVSVKVL